MELETNDIIRIWPDIKNIFAVAHSEAEYDRQGKALTRRSGVSLYLVCR